MFSISLGAMSTLGDIMTKLGGCHEYLGCVQYIGEIPQVHPMYIMSTAVGYHEYIREIS